MSKFSELAQFTKETMADWDTQADDLMANGRSLKARGDEVFQKHRAKQAEAHAGFKAMEDAVREMTGANGGPNEQETAGSHSSSGTFPVAAADNSGTKVD